MKGFIKLLRKKHNRTTEEVVLNVRQIKYIVPYEGNHAFVSMVGDPVFEVAESVEEICKAIEGSV